MTKSLPKNSMQKTRLSTAFLKQIVAIPRFELGQTAPKTVVLPLHQIAIKGKRSDMN